VLAACGERGQEQDDAAADQAEPIVAHRIAHEREETVIQVVGTARARAFATIYPETSGQVVEVLFAPGDFVEAGAPLVRLDAREEQLAVDLARVAVQEAEQLLARYRRIENTGAVSASQIDEARTALDAAQIELQQAEVALSKRTIVAPFAGYLGLSDVDPGAQITSTTVIAQLDDRRSLYVDFSPPEQIFGRVAVGDIVTMSPFAEAGPAPEARIVAIDSRIEPTRRTFTVRAEIDNADDALRPGMSFSVNFAVPGDEFPAVPEAAMVWGNDGASVWRVVDGVAQETPVAVMLRTEGRVLVRGDLPEGSVIVTEGVHKMREGMAVRDVGGEIAVQADAAAGGESSAVAVTGAAP
jgi:RND family efflux transporter MFP subunit